MAAATPKAAFMFVADDWPDIDEGEFQTHEVARALVVMRPHWVVQVEC